MMKYVLTLALVLPLVGMTQNANARGKRGGQGKVMKELNLSKDQKKQMKALKKGKKESMKAQRTKMKELRKSMHEAMKNNASESDLRGKHKALHDAKRSMADARLENMLAVRKILNDEQRKKFHELKAKQWEGRKGKRGHDDGEGDDE